MQTYHNCCARPGSPFPHRAAAPAEAQGLFKATLAKPQRHSSLFDILMTLLAHDNKPRPAALPKPTGDKDMATRHPLRILLAEDDLVMQKLAMRLLSQMGCRADLAVKGIEAIEAVERQPYAVVLMDAQMPGMDGSEASRSITAKWPSTQRPRIVAMTANALQGDREECLAAGMASKRILDPQHSAWVPGTAADCTISAAAFVRLDPAVHRVFITENEINFKAFPPAAERAAGTSRCELHNVDRACHRSCLPDLPARLACRTCLPDAAAGLTQTDGQFHFNFAGGLAGHRVADLVQRGDQAQAVLKNKSVGLDARLVPVESQVGIESRHADVDEWFAELAVGVGAAKTGFVPDAVGQFNHVHMMAVPTLTWAGHG